MNARTVLEILGGLPKSIILNYSQFPLCQAIKLPVLVSRRVKFKSLRGSMRIDGASGFGQIRIGLNGVGAGTSHHLPTVIENNGVIIFKGRVFLGGGGENMHSKCIE